MVWRNKETTFSTENMGYRRTQCVMCCLTRSGIALRLNLAGHCHPELVAHKGSRSRGGKTNTCVETLLRDTDTKNVNKLSSLIMADQVLWKKLSRIRVPRDPA